MQRELDSQPKVSRGSSTTWDTAIAPTTLLRMMQEIPLTDEEKSAVEDGIAALNSLVRLTKPRRKQARKKDGCQTEGITKT